MRARSARVIPRQLEGTRPLTLAAPPTRSPRRSGEGDHLVIVDNGSDDDSLTVLREGLGELRGAANHARVSLVNAGTNDGFGAGVMAGAAGLEEGTVVLLNNDATVRDGFLDALLAPLGEAVGATTALILLTGRWRPAAPSDEEFLVARDGSRWTRVTETERGGQVLINSTGNEVDNAGNGYDRSWLDPADSPLPAPEVFGLCGGACAIDADAWRVVGGVRTDLFMYYEDTDLSYKLREAGYEVRFVAGAVVDHEHAASSGTSSPMFLRVNARNRIIVAAQHAPLGRRRARHRSLDCARRALGWSRSRRPRSPPRPPRSASRAASPHRRASTAIGESASSTRPGRAGASRHTTRGGAAQRRGLDRLTHMVKTVLVTGAGGYIGRHIVHALLERGLDVSVVDFRLDGVDERARRIDTQDFQRRR